MTLAAPEAVPPTVLPEPPKSISTPWTSLPRGMTPFFRLPMRLPCILLPEPVILTPSPSLPEMRLRASGRVSPGQHQQAQGHHRHHSEQSHLTLRREHPYQRFLHRY